MALLQLSLIVLVAVIDFGLLGRQSNDFFSATVGLIVVWAFTWFGSPHEALRLTLLLGGTYALIGFLPLLAWPIIFVGAYGITYFLKQRFFELSSFPLALLTLAIVSVWLGVILSVFSQSFTIGLIVGGAIANVMYGAVIYYALGARFKFLQRWAGRRL